MEIRSAKPQDCAELLKIYGQYIDTPITFEYVLPPCEEFAARITEISADYPYLVCEENGKIVGYAYAHRFKERAAYQWGAELSVYLEKNFTSKGLGKKLYRILEEILKIQNVKTVYGGVTSPNVKSEKLHKSLGFSLAGTYRKTGYKCGQWLDVSWYEKTIAPHTPEPEPFKSIKQIPESTLYSVIQEEFNEK